MWHLTLSWCRLSSAHDTCPHTWCWGHTSLGQKTNLLGNLEFSLLAIIICLLKIVWQKRSSAYRCQREHRQKLESEKWKLFFMVIIIFKVIPKMKQLKLFSRWIVLYTCIYSQDEQFSSPKLQEARPAGLWQGSDGWLPPTEKDTIQEGIRWIQMGSDGVWWVIATDWGGYNSRRVQIGSDYNLSVLQKKVKNMATRRRRPQKWKERQQTWFLRA